MADKPRRQYKVGPPANQPLERTEAKKRYFFLEDKIYKVLRQERSRDILTAWDFDEKKIVHFVLSDAKRNMRPAYDTVEVARLLNRSRATVQGYVNKGYINSPARVNEKGTNSYGHSFAAMKWSEDDILALHTYLLTKGGGRPRKDGTLYAGARLPSRRELLALMRQQPMFYMKTSSGEMVPVWSAYNGV